MKYLAILFLLSAACATAPAVPTAPPSDPLAVAENWAQNPTEELAFTSAWSVPGQVARIYAEGTEFKALLVDQKGQGAEGVLLTIAKNEKGIWMVISVNEAPSTHLFPKF